MARPIRKEDDYDWDYPVQSYPPVGYADDGSTKEFGMQMGNGEMGIADPYLRFGWDEFWNPPLPQRFYEGEPMSEEMIKKLSAPKIPKNVAGIDKLLRKPKNNTPKKNTKKKS